MVRLLDIPHRHVHLAWERLETLEISNTGTHEEELSLLRRCIRLQSLKLPCISEIADPLMPTNPVVLSSIRSLEILHFSRLLQNVALPNLQHLDISPITPAMIPEFRTFLSQWGCTLQSISSYLPYSPVLEPVLDLIPSLTNLDISSPGVFFRFAAALEVPGILPQLEVLSMTFCEDQMFGLNELVRMLRARRTVAPAHVVLQSFNTLLLNLDELDCAPFLSLLEETGLEICVPKAFPPQVVFAG
ncbi:hypothetical protein C8R43DRAFT_1118808 [Mycena crocata]|nr:hypothetical protein C8R43DRAFT_1118808 [Mycena crocata]